MSNYLHSAISKIYGEDDDFILIGLTGRTGSGCSTVARILAQDFCEIKHSLFIGENPVNNQERKEKIISRYISKNWISFSVIQVRSILTLLLSSALDEDVRKFVSETIGSIDSGSVDAIISEISLIRIAMDKAKLEKKVAEFYTLVLPQHSDAIKLILSESTFVRLYQTIGANVRNSGSAIDSRQINGEFFALAKKINEAVKDIRDENLGKKTFIVIDAIRNPFEAFYFQERFSSFYLMAVSCDDEQRKRRLRGNGYTEDEIKNIDKQEYFDGDISSESAYVLQDIASCLQKADLYLSNPDSLNIVSSYQNLANQVLTFVALMKQPGLVTPTALERCMQIAYTAKLNSGCISRQVGAVVTDKNFSIQSIGWNDAPHGQVPCNLRNRFDLESGSDQAAYSQYEKTDQIFLTKFRERTSKYIPIVKTGRNVSYCFKAEYNKNTGEKNQVHTRSLHAEENAFLQISKYGGRGVEGGKLFTTASPCELCAKKAYQLGVREIYYIDPYPGIAMKHILMGGSQNPELVLFSGAIGRAFHRLYTPIVAYKDELSTLAEPVSS